MIVDRQFVIELQGRQYVQVVGLVDAAHKAGLKSIESAVRQVAGPENGWHAVVGVTVTFADGDTWSAIGDADPSTTRLKAYERLAETRALGRALRWKLNVAELAYEELPQDENGTARREDLAPSAATEQPARPHGPRPAVHVDERAAVRRAERAQVGKASGPAGHCQVDGCNKPLTKEMLGRSQSRAQMALCPAHLIEILEPK